MFCIKILACMPEQFQTIYIKLCNKGVSFVIAGQKKGKGQRKNCKIAACGKTTICAPIFQVGILCTKIINAQAVVQLTPRYSVVTIIVRPKRVASKQSSSYCVRSVAGPQLVVVHVHEERFLLDPGTPSEPGDPLPVPPPVNKRGDGVDEPK